MNSVEFDMNLAKCFAAGAADAARKHEMSEKDAEDFAIGICKQAAAGYFGAGGDDDTFWSRNKGWLLPVLVGSLSFWAGASGERHGRPDRGYLSNAVRNIWSRLTDLAGENKDPVFRHASGEEIKAKDL